LQGDAKELPLTISGEGEIRQVSGEQLQDWSIRQEADSKRTLLLRPKRGEKPLTQLAVVIVAEYQLEGRKNPFDVKVSDAEKDIETHRTFLNVNADGSVVWNHKVVTFEELGARL